MTDTCVVVWWVLQEVTSEEGRRLASEYGMSHIEVSARTGEGVERCFTTLCMDILARLPAARRVGGESGTVVVGQGGEQSEGDSGCICGFG
jgi:hypothetical protein